jgi:hypothetical protein
MKNINYKEQHLDILIAILIAGSMIFLTAGCSEDNGGTIQNTLELPTDSMLDFYCENEGVYLEKCALKDPGNPYASVAVTEDNKFQLNDDAPSAKSRFYLWATAMARLPSGENQYYTALSLQEVFAESGSPTTRDQAVKAYRSVLDNYFFAPTFFIVTVNGEEVAFAVSLKDVVGKNLYDPDAANLVSLYTDPVLALQDISEWGFIYNPAIGENGLMSLYK